MTLGGIHPFFKAALEAQGLKEWRDGFNTSNIPSSVLDNSFHVMIGSIAGGPANHLLHEFRASVTVRMFFKGYRHPQEAKDLALDKAHAVLNALLRPSVRLQSDGLKDIRPQSVQAVPLAASNDNSIIMELVFECVLNYRFA